MTAVDGTSDQKIEYQSTIKSPEGSQLEGGTAMTEEWPEDFGDRPPPEDCVPSDKEISEGLDGYEYENGTDEDDKPIGETTDRYTGGSMLLIVNEEVASDSTHRLLDRLREDYGYGVVKEYSGPNQTVYSVTPEFYRECQDS